MSPTRRGRPKLAAVVTKLMALVNLGLSIVGFTHGDFSTARDFSTSFVAWAALAVAIDARWPRRTTTTVGERPNCGDGRAHGA